MKNINKKSILLIGLLVVVLIGGIIGKKYYDGDILLFGKESDHSIQVKKNLCDNEVMSYLKEETSYIGSDQFRVSVKMGDNNTMCNIYIDNIQYDMNSHDNEYNREFITGLRKAISDDIIKDLREHVKQIKKTCFVNKGYDNVEVKFVFRDGGENIMHSYDTTGETYLISNK